MKINQLTFLRFLAAILVVVFHFGRETTPFNFTMPLRFVGVLNCTVSFFFVLSGFVLAVSNWGSFKVDKKTFYFNRFVRVFPLYALALLIFLLPKVIDGSWVKDVSAKHLIMNLSLTQAIFSDNALSLNYPGWSLSVEFCLYLLFPFVFNFLAKKTTTFVIGACSIFWIITMVTYALSLEGFTKIPWSYTQYFPAFHLSTFAMGIGTGLIYCRHKEILNSKRKEFLISTLLSAVLFMILIATENPIIKYHHSGLFNPFYISAILLFSLDRAPLKTLLSSKPFVILGEASYGIYILQYSLWCLFFNIGSRFNLPWLFNFYVDLIGLVICSVICYFFFERPINKRFKISRNVGHINKKGIARLLKAG